MAQHHLPNSKKWASDSNENEIKVSYSVEFKSKFSCLLSILIIWKSREKKLLISQVGHVPSFPFLLTMALYIRSSSTTQLMKAVLAFYEKWVGGGSIYNVMTPHPNQHFWQSNQVYTPPHWLYTVPYSSTGRSHLDLIKLWWWWYRNTVIYIVTTICLSISLLFIIFLWEGVFFCAASLSLSIQYIILVCTT